MRAKETDAISGMHMPAGESMWASPALDKIPGGLADEMSISDFDPKAIEKGMKVELEHTDDEDLAKEIAMDHLKEEPKYYDKLEVMEKKALGLTSMPGEQQQDYQFEQPFHIKDPDNVGVIDVETVVDIPPINNAEDSSLEKKMKDLLEDLIHQLESRGYNKYSSLIKKSQQTSVQYSSETYKRVSTAKSVLSNLIESAGVGSDWERFISSMITPAGISNGTVTFSWLRAWVAVAALWRDMSNSGLYFDQYKGGAKVSPAQSEWAAVGKAINGWGANTGPAQAFAKMMQMDKEYGQGRIADTMGSLEEYMQTIGTGNLGPISEDFSSGYSIRLQKEQPKVPSQQARQAPQSSKYRFVSEDDAQRSGVRQVQTAIGVNPDGWWGPRTDAAWKAKYGEIPGSLKEAISIISGQAEAPSEATVGLTDAKKPAEQPAQPGAASIEPSRENIMAGIKRLMRGMPMRAPGIDQNVLDSGRVRRMTKRYLRGIGSDRTIRTQEDQDRVIGLAATAIGRVDIGGKSFAQAVKEGLAGKTGDQARQIFDGLVWQFLQRAWAAAGKRREQGRMRRLEQQRIRQLDRAEKRSQR